MKRAFLLGAAVLLWSGSARADLPVIDIAGYTISLEQLRQALKQVQDAETMVTQGVTEIGHLKSVVDAAVHGDVLALAQLGPELSGLGIGDLVSPGAGAAQLMDAASGVVFATGRLSSLANQVMQQDAFYLPPGGNWSADRVIAAARLAAGQKAFGQSSFDASARQIKALEAVRTKAAGAGDILAAQQATVAISAIQAKATMESNQISATRIMQNGQQATLVAQTQQMSRCAYERLSANAKAAQAAAAAGTIELFTNTNVACSSTSDSAQLASADPSGTMGSLFATVSIDAPGGTVGTLFGGAPSDGAAVATMTNQPWGSDAVQIAQAQGISPDALAATCVIESNCRNVAGTGSITGPFQMTASTQSAAMRTALATNPDLASYAGTDAAQAVAASQELKNNAVALQGMGVQSPTLLQARALYQWGAGAGPGVALAGDGATMGAVLPQYTAAQLAANGVSPSMTVGAWRSSVAAKLGPAAYQPVLTASST